MEAFNGLKSIFSISEPKSQAHSGSETGRVLAAKKWFFQNVGVFNFGAGRQQKLLFEFGFRKTVIQHIHVFWVTDGLFPRLVRQRWAEKGCWFLWLIF